MFNRIKNAWTESVVETQKELNEDLGKVRHISGADDSIVRIAGWMYIIIGLLSAFFLVDGLYALAYSWFVFFIGVYVLTHIKEIDIEYLKQI